MGTIEHRSKNSWRIGVQVKTSSGWEWVRVSLRMDPALPESVQRQRAEKELDLLEKRLAGQQASTWTLADWSEEWLQKHVAPDLSPVTVANYRHLLKSRILPQLGDRDLTELTPAVLTDWLISVRESPRRTTGKPDDQLARKRAPSDRRAHAARTSRPLSANTVLHYYTCMEAMLSAAVRMGYLEHNPMESVRRPKLRKAHASVLPEEDALRLIAALADQDPRLRMAVLLGLICGLRLGEVTALTFQDIDWDRGTLNVSRAIKYTPDSGSYEGAPKSDAGERLITLPAAMLRELKDLAYQYTADGLDADDAGRPWHNSQRILYARDGSGLHHDTPSKWFRTFADDHGFPGLTFHGLRHAHASLLLAHNIDVVAVASRMGHSDPGVTLRVYAHALPARDQDAARYFDQLLAHPSADS